MSWQRIFRTARRLGSPVIFTDQAGNDPMIVLPLDDYERLIEQPSDFGPTTSLRVGRQFEPEAEMESLFELPFEEDMPLPNTENLAQKRPKGPVRPVEEEIPDQAKDSPDNQEISLDERFYFEPLEDEDEK